MSQEIVRKFIDALHQLEESGDVDAIARLFTEEATLSNAAAQRTFDGPDGAREFWRSYRANFRDIHSDFRRIIGSDEGAALEWESEGTGTNGQHFRYSGVSLIDLAGDGISRFHAYFDPLALGDRLTSPSHGGHADVDEDSERNADAAESQPPRSGGALRESEVTDTSYATPGRMP